MDEGDRRNIKCHLDQLCPLFKLDVIVPFLFHKRIFNNAMIQDILAIDDEVGRKKRLLMDLCRRGPEAYKKFLEVLRETGHNAALAVLGNKLGDSCDVDLSKDNQQGMMTNQSLQSLNIKLRYDNENHRIWEKMNSIQKGTGTIKVAPAMSWACYDNTYRMDTNPRGYCLIINNVDFDLDVYETRTGSDADAKRLDDVFQELGFKVILRRNVKGDDIKKLVKTIATKPELTKMNAFVMIILSHGKNDCVFGTDIGVVDVYKDLISPFSNANCPGLIGKPKVFFIQACRGEERDFGVTVPEEARKDMPWIKPNQMLVSKADTTTEPNAGDLPQELAEYADRSQQDKKFKIPSLSDVLIVFPTLFGYVAMRNPDYGSWFCSVLAMILAERAMDLHLLDILTEVDSVIQNMQSHDGEKCVTHINKIGFKKLYFNPGLYRDQMP